MQSHDICLLLVTCLAACLPQSQGIRVDWGTNQGPIVPPTPRTTPAPQLPYREPAPVWEDQSDDIPNPNPYVFVLPPPSRPRTWPIPIGPYQSQLASSYSPPSNRGYGALITPQQAQGYVHGGGGASVAALSPQYVPGVGLKYTAVVPKKATTSSAQNIYYLGITDKLQGKYNAKTKKYKAYEKAKYTPLNYYRLFDADSQYVPQYDAEQLLPLAGKPLNWQPIAATSSSSSSSSSSTTSTTTPLPATTKTISTSTTTTTTHQPTTSRSKRLIGNYKLAHEKSAYVKQPPHHKKKQQQQQPHQQQHQHQHQWQHQWQIKGTNTS